MSVPVVEEFYRCDICQLIPAGRNHFNPAICTFCGKKVCELCYTDHRAEHKKVVTPEKEFLERLNKAKFKESTTGQVDPDEVPF